MHNSAKVKRFVASVLVSALLFSCSSPAPVNNEVIKPVIEPLNPYAPVDKSPMDISYCPANYPMLQMSGTAAASPVARLIYSRPQKNGRAIFGDEPPPKFVQQYGSYWRLGANEASEIEFFQPVLLKDKKIAKGRYIIYCIPFRDKWTIVLNSNLFSWGLHQDAARDIVAVDVPVQQNDRNIETFTMVFQDTTHGANLLMTWDNVKAELPISF